MNKTMFKRITVCTDLSEDARAAELYALQLAKEKNVILNVLHVCSPIENPDEIHLTDDEILNQYLSQKRAVLKKRFKAEEVQMVNFHLLISEDNASREILKFVIFDQSSLLIVGSHGESKFQGNSFGSITTHVIQESPVSVLVIPPNLKFEHWDLILLASKDLFIDSKNIEQLQDNLSPYKKFDICQVLFSAGHNSTGRTPFLGRPSSDSEVVTISSDDVTKSLDELIQTEKYQCLVLFFEEKGFFEALFSPNIITQALYQIETALLIIKKQTFNN